MNTFVAVHGGAGSYGYSSEAELKQALRLACKKALASSSASTSTSPSLDATEAAISYLEDVPTLNAGIGSNLTIAGTVECDAAIMDGQSHFGSVGAVSGVKNPIRVARALLEHSTRPDPLGRIPPLTLVSSGAHAFASKYPLTSSGIVDGAFMITQRAQDRWRYWKDKLASASLDESRALLDQGHSTGESLHDVQDTVGAVASCSGKMSAGVSSGGLLLKLEGRLGEAATFGAGCWAQDSSHPSLHPGIACSISGTGEYITRSHLARTLVKAAALADDPHDIIRQIVVDEFWKPSRDLGEPSPSAGILLMTYEDGDDEQPIVRVWCAFTTPCMAIAYASSRNPTPKTLILRQPKDPASSRMLSNDKVPVYMTAFSL